MLPLVIALLFAAPTEVERVDRHLARVEAELWSADTTALRHDQRILRAAVLDELHRYRTQRVFPHNHDFVLPMPYFIDEHGVRCAMAHLIEKFGGASVVQRIARTNNNVFVYQLTKDADVLAWLAAHGLSIEDAARIQPTYFRGYGNRCQVGASQSCQPNTGDCVVADDDPQLAYCSLPCDAALSNSCPDGVGGPMTCIAVGDGALCRYPEPTPGTLGTACDPGTSNLCAHSCIGSVPSAFCTRACSQDKDCPGDYTCGVHPQDEVTRVCRRSEGCNAAHDPSGSAAIVLALLLATRRRRRTATSRPTVR